MTKQKKDIILSVIAVCAILILVFALEHIMPPTSMLFSVLQKGAIIALVAVSMNLLNGFTGLFSLGQAGFMLIGAYVYAVFTIPAAARASVYQYYDGGLIQFELPWVVALILAGVAAAIAKVLFDDDEIFFRIKHPNMLCYRKVYNALMEKMSQ